MGSAKTMGRWSHDAILERECPAQLKAKVNLNQEK